METIDRLSGWIQNHLVIDFPFLPRRGDTALTTSAVFILVSLVLFVINRKASGRKLFPGRAEREATKSALEKYTGMAYDATKKLEAGCFDEAIGVSEKAIAGTPGAGLRPAEAAGILASFYTIRGSAFIGKNDYKKALEDFNRAADLDPFMVSAYSNRATVYMNLGDNEKALADFNTAVRLNPRFAYAYTGRAEIHAAMEHYADSYADVKKALKPEPKNPDALLLLDTLKKKTGIQE